MLIPGWHENDRIGIRKFYRKYPQVLVPNELSCCDYGLYVLTARYKGYLAAQGRGGNLPR